MRERRQARSLGPGKASSRLSALPQGKKRGDGGTKQKAGYAPAFLSFFAARFSLSDFSGFFLVSFFLSRPLAMLRSVW